MPTLDPVELNEDVRTGEKLFSNNSRDSFARLICSAKRRQARCIYDEDSLTIRNLSSANERSPREDVFVEDELNSMNRADGSRMLLLVHRERVRMHAVQKALVTLGEHKVH